MPVQPTTFGDNRVMSACVGEDFFPKHLWLYRRLDRKFRAVFEQSGKSPHDMVVGVSLPHNPLALKRAILWFC